MRIPANKMTLRIVLFTAMLLAGGLAIADTTVNLAAQRSSTTMPDGTSVPMWQLCGGLDSAATNAGTTTGGTCGGAWAPGPTITVPVGDTLTINLTNSLNVPTSIVVLGQLGGGLGQGTRMDSPVHAGQAYTTFPGNGAAATPFKPPAQGTRVQSFGTEVLAGSTGSLCWGAGCASAPANLKPGTYVYETGTLPSLQAPMGLYGLLIVTNSPKAADTTGGTPFIPGTAYTGVPYDADLALLFSEIDPVQNRQVDVAERADNGTVMTANLRFNDAACGSSCYPAAVNYTPAYFLINGHAFDQSSPTDSFYKIGGDFSSGKLLLRLANAGLRTHIPSVVGPTMDLVAEDGNPLPGKYKTQSEVLLTAGKTHDVLINSPANGASYAPVNYPFFDRQGSLTNGNQPFGGMLGYLLVGSSASNPVTPANLSAQTINDVFAAALGVAINGNVKTNDIAVKTVALVGSGPSNGTLTFNTDGSFIYAPNPLFNGVDTFTYNGNTGTTNTATVTLTVGSTYGVPVANADSFTSNVATVFKAASPGILANDTSPGGYKLTVDKTSLVNNSLANGGCGAVALNADGSFTATRGASSSCSFTYSIKNSQGLVAAEPATVSVSFKQGSGLALNVIDAKKGDAITDYRWTIQEDLTFKPDTSATPSLSTRTLGTSFHRAHNTVVATGCVGTVSCGTDQQVRGAKVPATPETRVGDVALDPTKHYYISVLPGDAQNPVVNGGGGPVDIGNGQQRPFDITKDCRTIGDPTDPCGHMMGGTKVGAQQLAALSATIKLQRTPLVPAQLSIFIYEDNSPTNGQNDLNENGLGDFSVILVDPVGRSGDPAGQQTYDSFNMPVTNALLGSPGCPNTHSVRSAAAAGNNIVGEVYTCPNAPANYRGDPAVYALAGHALIKNITPARYDVIAHPGAARGSAGEVWMQTETLEGTPAQDAFTGINEATYFQEFGPPGFHTTIGFVNPKHLAGRLPTRGGHTVTGHVTSEHMSHPSNTTLWNSGSYDLLNSTTCYVALNDQGGTGNTLYVGQCDADGNYSIAHVPAGSYEVAIWDQWLDQIIQTAAVTVGSTDVAMGDIPVFSWFTQHDQYQLLDDGTGKLTGIPNVLMTVRYRNGSISNQTLTDASGNGLLVELFPLFNWYVSESDTTRFKQKAVTLSVDGGGAVDATGDYAGLISSKYADGTSSIRTETPGAYSYGIQGYISQRNRIDWIKTPYAPGENGGIQGTVVYASTRAFDDQRYNVQTIWEPLVPRVQVNLYRKTKQADGTETLVKVDSTQTTSWDDWVNTVFGADGNKYILGSDQKLRDPATGVEAAASAYPAGKQVNMSCPGQLLGPKSGAQPPYDTTAVDPFTNYTLQGDLHRCYDGFHNWNQAQAAPYDGKYQFPSDAYIAAHPTDIPAGGTLVTLPAGDYVVEVVTPDGYEVVKEEDKNILIGDAFIAPVTQQFGSLGSIFILPDQATLNNSNPYNPNTGDAGFQTNPTSNLGAIASKRSMPECVGDSHRVPDYLSLYPQAQQAAPFAGMDRPLCDKKLVKLGDQMQAIAAFFVYTGAPIAANATGIILDDASSEFNAASPDFGEKASVPFVPVSTKDFTGNEVSRVYSDQWGAYNLMLPSSWLVNPPTPSGYGPNMLVNCINDPGPILDTLTGKMITDPAYNPAYSNFCYTNPFMPGQATYLDTPVLPIAAFAAGYNPVDCAYPDATPAISRVDTEDGFGPYVSAVGKTITIKSQGIQTVQNPAYAGPFATSGPASQRTITRNYGFGVTAGTVTVNGVALTNVSWSDAEIKGTIANGTTTGELVITATKGKSTTDAVTVTVGGTAPKRVVGGNGDKIQDAVDAATPGDLILVDAGTYNELVIMWKPVRLQGVGAASVIINAAKYPTTKLHAWRPRINSLFAIDVTTGNQTGPSQVDPLPGQEITGGVVLLEPSVLGTEEGAGITVLAKDRQNLINRNRACTSVAGTGWESDFLCAPSRIDGLSVTGGDAGGGIYVNGWAHNLEIANNRVYGNAGALNGGVRIGVPYLDIVGYPGQTQNTNGDLVGSPALSGGVIAGMGFDQNVKIHHNAITKNGVVEGTTGQGGAGGGVSISSGSDNYSVDHNLVCGNYSQSDGGGIGHIGFSQNGQITNNQVLFNQSFQQSVSTHGGGIFVGGEPALALQTLTLGTGNVTVDSNVIRGNFAETGHGGGVRIQQVNGADVESFNTSRECGNNISNCRSRWNKVTLTNNIIDNNVAGWSGGGVSLADTLVSVVDNNTIALNDSAGIAGSLLAGGTLPSTTTQAGTGKPNPAGIAAESNSAALIAVIPNGNNVLTATQSAISSPVLDNNIVWHNRSFFFKTVSGQASLCSSNNVADASGNGCTVLPDQATTGQCTGSPAYWDLGVVGDTNVTSGVRKLSPTYSVMTAITGYGGANNSNANPNLADIYCNGSRITPEFAGVINPPSPKSLQVAATVDEGNNYVSLRYGPLTTVNPSSGAAFGDYHFASTATAGNSSGVDHGKIGVSTHDIDNQSRPQGAAWDIGADELKVPTPIASLSSSSLAFGNQGVNTNVAQVVTLTNTGDATLSISGITIVGTNANQFSRTTTCGAALAANATCTITVTFAPTTGGNKAATLSIADNAVGSPQSVTLSGTGVPPATVGFSWQNDGTVGSWANNSGSRTITVTNNGQQGSQLSLTTVPLVTNVTGGSQFSRTGGSCSATTVLNRNQSCTVTVSRARNGNGTGTLTISDTGAATSQQTLNLSGS